ncbi:MAG: hypothetical protein V4729_05180 [Pseudomonadota bacterium]
MIDIHPSAIENFNRKAELLIPLLKVMPRQAMEGRPLSNDMPIGVTITDKEIIGEIKESIGDHKGRTNGRFFSDNGARLGMIGDDYKQLMLLAESIQRQPSIRDKLSQEFIEEALFSWIQGRLQRTLGDSKFSSYLESRFEESVKSHTMYVPISSMIVEEEFQVFGVAIHNLTKVMVDELASVAESVSEGKDKVEKFFERFRMDYQGRAVISIQLECEHNHAQAVALGIAKDVTDILGIFSGALLVPDVKSAARAKGTEHIDQYTVILRSGEGGLNVSSGFLDQASVRHWVITKSDVKEYKDIGLDALSSIYLNKSPTAFESAILSMAYLYSKAAFTADPMEKLICMLSALESMLLKNESEPIQQNLAERMAIISAQQLEKRKSIVKNVRAVYGLRSRYLHHGHSSSELDQLSEFFMNVWVFFWNLVSNSKTFSTREEFLSAIDDHKLS